MKPDKATGEFLAYSGKIANTVGSDGWQLIKDRINEKIRVLDSITSMPDDVVDLKQELKARAGAISIIQEWIGEIEGIARQHEATENAMEDDIIQKFD